LQQAQQSDENPEVIKQQIKTNYPVIYQTFWLEKKSSIGDLLTALNQQIETLTKSKTTISKKIKAKFDSLVFKSTKEATEKDQTREEVLTFLNAIGFDTIAQNKLDAIIAIVNMHPQHYGLQKPINFETGSLGFDQDF